MDYFVWTACTEVDYFIEVYANESFHLPHSLLDDELGWNLMEWQVNQIFNPGENYSTAVTCLEAVGDQLWCGCDRTVVVVNPHTLHVEVRAYGEAIAR